MHDRAARGAAQALLGLALAGCGSADVVERDASTDGPEVDAPAAVEAGLDAREEPSPVAEAGVEAGAWEASADGSADASGCTLYAGSQSCTGALPHLYLCPDACPAGMADLASGGFVDGGPVVWCCGP